MNRFSLSPSRLAPASLALCLALSGIAHAQTLPALAPGAQISTRSNAQTAPDANAILINIDGRVVTSDPPPLLQNGRTFVPLRGVLENLGATVNYIPATKRVDIARGGQNVTLFLGTTRAQVDGREVEVEQPLLRQGRAFVPLRAVSELFGLQVSWLAPTRTVAIYTGAPIARPADHRSELAQSGPFGVAIDFAAHPAADVPTLLDAAKSAGASLVKFRFDWGTLEPTKGAAFQWPVYDAIVREARARDLKIIGIFGDTAPWASVATSPYGSDKRQSPPREAELPSWSNYVRRVTGRYAGDVSAWQVWENPSSSNFRSVSRNYRKLAALALAAARGADPKALVYVAEPGGVDLDAVRGYNQNGLTATADGITVYPVAQFQPNALAAPEAFLRPYAQLRETLVLPDGVTRDYWIGGLSYPVALSYPGATPSEYGAGALKLFTPAAQADYLVKSMALSLAAGGGKVFWDQLRDISDPNMTATLTQAPAPDSAAAPAAVVVQPATSVENAPAVQNAPTDVAPDQIPATGTTAPDAPQTPATGTTAPDAATLSAPTTQTAPVAASASRTAPRDGVVIDDGLLRADGTPRPSYAAFKLMATHLGDKPYRGNLSFNSDLVALLFDNKTDGDLVVWSPAGAATLALNSAGDTINLPGAQFISTRPDSQVLDATGNVVSPPDGVLKIGSRPLLITKVASATVQAALANPAGQSLRLQDSTPYQEAQTVRAELSPDGAETGVFWRKYASFGGVAKEFVEREGRRGLTTQPQRDIYDLSSQKPFIYFDVADDFLYDAPGVPITLTVEVYAPALSNPNLALGFRVEYDSAGGTKSTPWNPLVAGSGWQKITLNLPDAQFANAGGYDFLINVGASAPLTFGSVEVTRGAAGAVVAP